MRETVVDLIRHGEPVHGRRYRRHGTDGRQSGDTRRLP